MLRGLPLLLLTAALATAPSAALASTITVDIRTDVMAADGHCSLREAIQAANVHAAPFPGAGECAAGDGNDTVVLPSGTLKLTIAGAGDDTNATGDLDVLDARLTISGTGANSTTIDANHLDRALDVLSGRIVRVQGVRVTDGTAPSGAAGANQNGAAGTPGTLAGNGSGGDGGAGGDGGGIRNAGSLSVVDSIVSGNAAGAGGKGGLGRGGDGDVGHIMAPGGQGGVGYGGRGGNGGSGGGIFSSGALTLLRTTVTQNAAGPGGAGSTGTGGQGGSAVGDRGGNGGAGAGGPGGAGGAGGGVADVGTGTVTIDQSSIAANVAGGAGVGGLGQGGAGGASSTGHAGDGGAGFAGAGGAGGAGGGVFAANRVAITSTLVAQNRTGAGAKGGDATGSIGGVTATTGSSLAGAGGLAHSGDGGAGGAGGGIIATLVAATNVTVAGNAAAAGAGSGAATGGAGGAAISSGTPGNGGNATTGEGGAGGAGGGIDAAGDATIRNATITGNTLGAHGNAGAATAGRGGSPPSAGTPGSPGTAAVGLPGADGVGGALRARATTTLANSIVAGNALLSCDGTVIDGGHDIAVPDVACPGANIDPLLAALADNGGPSRTQALLPGSPAIDALPAIGAGCPATDERGVPRPQGSACDIGAYEVAVGAAAGSGGVVLARLTKLGLSPKSFRAAAKGASAAATKRRRAGTTVTYTLNEAATVRFSLVRPRGGRRAGKRCVKPTKRNRKGRACRRLVKVSGSFTRRSSLGRNRFHFTGRLKGRKLKAGAYRLVATPSAGGRKGKAVSAAFRIVA